MKSSPVRTGRMLLTLGTAVWVTAIAFATLNAHATPEPRRDHLWWQIPDRLTL